MLDDDLHFGVVGEAPILLLEAEMGRMQVNDEGGRRLGVSVEDVGGGPDCNCNSVSRHTGTLARNLTVWLRGNLACPTTVICRRSSRQWFLQP